MLLDRRLNKSGCYIAFEGIDGCGKTTQLAMLFDHLSKENYPVAQSHEWSAYPVGPMVRQVISNFSDTLDLTTQTLLACAARSHLIKTFVQPHVKAGFWCLIDRSFLSTMVYQKAAFSTLAQYNFGCFPNVILFFDVEPAIAYARVHQRCGTIEPIENVQLAEFALRRKLYLDAIEEYAGQVKIIDANDDKDSVHEKVLEALRAS